MFTTNNEVLLKNHKPLPALNCIQYNAEKVHVEEDDVILANKLGFGSKIGSITNRITAMTSLMANYEPGSKEYETLRYRTQCGQAQQQAEIDRAKGIISNPMPKSWYIASENKINENDSEEIVDHKKFYQAICADKKPYFFIYNYQSLKNEYDTYMANVENKSQSIFAHTFNDLQIKPNKSEMEEKFVNWVNDKNPIDSSPSTMNKICWAIEKEFDNLSSAPRDKFDYSMLKSGHGYSSSHYYEILELHKWYKKKNGELGKKHNSEHYSDTEDNLDDKEQIVNYFIERCASVCPNQQELCDILIDICYAGRTDKEIAWVVCGETIIQNLLKKNNYNMYYPKKANNGEFWCGSCQFVMTKFKAMEGDEE